MTRDVATVFPDDSVQYATRIMRDEDCGALPVVDSRGRMIGMITDRDVAVRLVADGYDATHAIVADCMTDEVFACHVNDPLRGCMDVMSRHQIRRLPILNDRDQVIGIVSQGDLSRHAADSRGQAERHEFTETMGAVSEPSSSAYR
jgi:CBS domain-containing protein